MTLSNITTDSVINSDKRFRKIYTQCNKFTMTSIERMYALYKSVEYIINAKIPGDFVECGVWKGGSTKLIALTLILLNETTRKIYLYDTYSGMPPPTNKDVQISNGIKASDLSKRFNNNKNNDIYCYASLKEVKKNLLSTDYPKKNIFFIKGKLEKTTPNKFHKNIALLHLDVDWYKPTYHGLLHLFPKLAKSGVIVFDDYGHWLGAKKAIEKYFIETGTKILLNRTDYTGRIGIKI